MLRPTPWLFGFLRAAVAPRSAARSVARGRVAPSLRLPCCVSVARWNFRVPLQERKVFFVGEIDELDAQTNTVVSNRWRRTQVLRAAKRVSNGHRDHTQRTACNVPAACRAQSLVGVARSCACMHPTRSGEHAHGRTHTHNYAQYERIRSAGRSVCRRSVPTSSPPRRRCSARLVRPRSALRGTGASA
jgi:hypothetical protein